MSEIYDVLIVGSGPGGSTAAYFLGEAGKRVLMLEKESLPRYKTCGGGISAGLLEIFPFSFEPVIESHVKAVSYALGSREVTIQTPARPMRMVMRDRFDAYILAHSRVEVRQGAAVRKVTEQEDRVVVETRSGEIFEGRYLIGADGASSIVARELGLRRDKELAAALELEVKPAAEVFERFRDTAVFIFGELREGYLWIFPKSDHLSIGIAGLHPRPGELQATLQRVMERYRISLEGAIQHGHPLPFYTRRELISTRRALLVGDAAGLVDPFDGEGIRFAIKSGRLAALAILNGQPEQYPAWVQRQIGRGHLWARFLAYLFYRFPRACFALGVRNPFATQAFIDFFSERAGYPELILRLFGTLPLFLLTEVVARLVGLVGGRGQRERLRSTIYGI
ncbi:MAG TPA: geranylgeranyl reductase family protein [Anaerolineales bacterium]